MLYEVITGQRGHRPRTGVVIGQPGIEQTIDALRGRIGRIAGIQADRRGSQCEADDVVGRPLATGDQQTDCQQKKTPRSPSPGWRAAIAAGGPAGAGNSYNFV